MKRNGVIKIYENPTRRDKKVYTPDRR